MNGYYCYYYFFYLFVRLADMSEHIICRGHATISISHSDTCKAVSRWRTRRNKSFVNLGQVELHNCEVVVSNMKLDCRGNEIQHYATLLGIVKFQLKSPFCKNLLEYYNCSVELKVVMYDGKVEERRILCTRSKLVKLSRDERECGRAEIKIDDIELEDIVYSKTCPKHIFFKITASLEANKIKINVADSGCDDFVSVSMQTNDTSKK